MKLGLVGSSGGHLTHLYLLKEFWEQEERFWVTFKKEDAVSLLKEERVFWCYFPTNRNIINFFKNAVLAIQILKKEKPDFLVSTGAGAAVPFFYIGRLMGIKLVFIEVYDRIDKPTLTGRVVYPICNCAVGGTKEVLPKGS